MTELLNLLLIDIVGYIWNLVDELGSTERGEGGFGHTGVNN